MGWTLGEYQDRVLQLAADQSPNPNEITVWVNQCLMELQADARLEASATITLVPDTTQYTLPADLWRLKNLYSTITGYPVDLRDHFDHQPGFRLWEGKMIMQPTPTAADTLQLEYYKMINQLVNPTDVPNIPEEWHDLPYLYAAMRAKQQDAEFGEAQMFAFEYKERREAFKAIRNRSQRTGFRRMRLVRGWD